MRIVKFALVSVLVAAPLTLTGCLDYEDPFAVASTDQELPDSGNSDEGAPASILGQTMVQTVTWNDEKEGTISVGDTITYSFIDETTILGDGLAVIPTEYWSYTKSGNQGEVDLNYGNAGTSTEVITFTSETAGTYISYISLAADNSEHKHGGTFVIKPNEGCMSPYGQLTVYSTRAVSEDVRVYVDTISLGVLTEYYAAGDAPICGEPTGAGHITFEFTAGSHDVSALGASFDGSYHKVQLEACGCTLYELQ